MPREKEAYQDNLERIISRYPGKELLTSKEVATFAGVDSRTVKKRFPFKKGYISIAVLAREIS